MPNWCENKLTVDNVTPAFQEFLKEEGGFSFERMVKPNRPESDEAGWGTVAAQNAAWGTKWDLDENEAREIADLLADGNDAHFDTAWSPPINAIEALSQMFPEVSFTLYYHEAGMRFYGTADFSEGVCSDDYCNDAKGEHYLNFLVDELGYDEEDAKEWAGIEEE